MKPEHIVCSVVLDFMGSFDTDPDDEFKEIQKDVRKTIKNPVTFHNSKMVQRIEPKSDLVMFDFGGLLPGTNLMEDQSREIIKWSQDHPSALVLVISDFTFTHFIEPEMASLGLDKLHNVKSWNRCDSIPDWPGIVNKEAK